MTNTNKKKKNNLLIIIGILLAVSSIGLLVYASITLNSKHEVENKHLIELSYEELTKKLDKKESFILVATRTDCTHCATFKPVFKEILAKHDIIAYEISIDKLDDDEKADFNTIANITGTPTTIFIEDGEEKTTTNRLIGAVNSNKIENRLKALGYIKDE